jgi:predicted transcriptional regulator
LTIIERRYIETENAIRSEAGMVSLDWQEAEKIKEDHALEIKKIKQEVSNLKSQNFALQGQVNAAKYRRDVDDNGFHIRELHNVLLNYTREQGNGASLESMSRWVNLEINLLRLHLNELRNDDLIKEGATFAETTYTLAAKGGQRVA